MLHNVKYITIKRLQHFFLHRYFNDMFVDFDFAQETASKIKNTEQYITNQLVHDGLHEDSQDVINTLCRLSKREFN